MKILKYLGALAMTAFLVSSCAQESPNSTSVKGTISNEEGPIILSYVDATKRNPVPLDTMEVIDGEFAFSWEVDSVNFYTLMTSKNYYIPILVEPGEKIEFDIEGEDVNRKYTVNGSPGSSRINEINGVSKYAMARIDSLNTEAELYRDSSNYAEVKVKLDNKFQLILSEAQGKMKDFLDADPSSLANLFIFSQKVARVDLVPPTGNMAYYEKVAQALEANYPNNQHTNFFSKNIDRMRQAEQNRQKLDVAKSKLTPGSAMPNIQMLSPDGEVKSLSDLKGKVVLVDFWAAWCRPCRAENPNLVRMYTEYKDKGFDVFSVSLDGLPQQPNPKDDWVNAIKQDALEWPNHVSDLKGWTSDVVPQFGFQGIPYTILVDRDGSIIATELRGPALEAKLKSILGV